MPTPWSIVDAKSKLSEVLNRAEREAQFINRRDRQYVVLDGDEYRRLLGTAPSLKDLILQGPGLEGVDLTRGWPRLQATRATRGTLRLGITLDRSDV